jgi:tight adherence protein C
VVIAAVLAFCAGGLAALGLGMAAPRRGGSRREARGIVGALARSGRGLAAGRGMPGDLDARIAAAGRPGGLSAREVMAAKLAGGLAGGGLGVLLGAAAPGRLGLLLGAVGPAAGFLGPDLWLARRASERAQRVRRELPGLLDLLRVTVQAGASLPAALAEVGATASGPLAGEWRAVAREVELGVPLGAALEGLTVRLPQPEVRALCAALERALRHGSPLGRTLIAQARDARLALRRRVAEDAARAGPKIQLVVALLLVPSVLLMVAAALTRALVGGGGVPGY